jgi:hypothetical protein
VAIGLAGITLFVLVIVLQNTGSQGVDTPVISTVIIALLALAITLTFAVSVSVLFLRVTIFDFCFLSFSSSSTHSDWQG